jgi:hypothetical protein
MTANRRTIKMKTSSSLIIAVVACIATGCGGGGGSNGFGIVTGKVTDIDGNVVSGALVYVDGNPRETYSNTQGRYVIQNVPAEDVLIKATSSLNGVSYVGSNVARVYDLEQAKSINIVVVRSSQTARIKAVVRDNSNHLLQNAKVYAFPKNGGVYSASMAITDSKGECIIRDLLSGEDYDLLASGRGYQSSPDLVNLEVGETRTVNFILGNASDTLLAAPTNLEAWAWTTPKEVTRSPGASAAYEAIKNMVEPRRATRKKTTRSTIYGNYVEFDLYWDWIDSNKLLGYGIYRALGAVGTTVAVDYLRDPLASYYGDLDEGLIENQTYSYQITALNTHFPDGMNDESAKSDRVTAIALGDMDLLGVLQGPLTFEWYAVTGANTYTVYLYDRYPSVESITPVWTSVATSATHYDYDGPILTPGHTYYYFVIGGNGANSRTISVIDSFTAN